MKKLKMKIVTLAGCFGSAGCLSWAVWIAMVTPILIAKPIKAQETLSSVQRDLDRVDKEIEREKEMHKTERKRAGEYETEKAAKLKALQDQIKITQGKIDSLKKQALRAQAQKSSMKAQTMAYQNRQKEFLKSLITQIQSMAKSLDKDFPYDKEKRISDLNELAKAIESGTVGLEDGLSRFFILMQNSLNFAYETEMYRGTYLATDGTSHEGNFIRMGAALLAFADEDGKIAAYITKNDTGYSWQDQNLSPEIKTEIFTAVKVAQGKVAPQLVNLPFKAPKVVETTK